MEGEVGEVEELEMRAVEVDEVGGDDLGLGERGVAAVVVASAQRRAWFFLLIHI